jgi:hypothetical protein
MTSRGRTALALFLLFLLPVAFCVGGILLVDSHFSKDNLGAAARVKAVQDKFKLYPAFGEIPLWRIDVHRRPDCSNCYLGNYVLPGSEISHVISSDVALDFDVQFDSDSAAAIEKFSV